MKLLILSLSLFLFSCATVDKSHEENKKEEYITATVISSSYNGQLTCFKKDTSTYFHRNIDYYSIQSNPDFDCYRNLYKVRYKYHYNGKDIVNEKFYEKRLKRDEKILILKDNSNLIKLKQ